MYPKFVAIDLKHKNMITSYTDLFKPYCDFNFANLINWSSPIKPTEYSILNGNLVIKMLDFTTDKELVSFIGKNKLKDTVYTLINDFGELTTVPEECLVDELHNDPNLIIEEDVANHNYILSLENVSLVKGKKLKSKRQYINRFKRLYPFHTVVELDITNPKIRTQIIDLYKIWKDQKKFKRAELYPDVAHEEDRELQSIKNFIANIKHYGKVFVVGLYDSAKLIGFTTNQAVRADTVIGSFGKGDINYIGIYPYLEHATAKYLKNLGYTYLNYEQNLGISGLKMSKDHWSPVDMFKSYIVKGRNNGS